MGTSDQPPLTRGATVRFKVDVRSLEDVDVVTAAGELDLFSCTGLRAILDDLGAERGRDVIVDLNQVHFMDSTAVSVLVIARRDLASREAQLIVVCPPSPALRVLQLVGLDQVFVLHDSVEEALSGSRVITPDA